MIRSIRSGRCVGSGKSISEVATICKRKKTPKERKCTNYKTEGRRTTRDLSLDLSLSSISWVRVKGTQTRRGKVGETIVVRTGSGTGDKIIGQ